MVIRNRQYLVYFFSPRLYKKEERKGRREGKKEKGREGKRKKRKEGGKKKKKVELD